MEERKEELKVIKNEKVSQEVPKSQEDEWKEKMAVLEQERINLAHQEIMAVCEKYGVDLKIVQTIQIIPRR